MTPAMELDRNGLMVLSPGQCLRLLRRARVGRVVVNVDGVPAAFPVNFALLNDDIVFRTALGTKLTAALEGSVVGFEVDRIDPVFESGWSVLIQGTSAVITDDDDLLRARRLHLRSWAPGERPHFVRIRPESVSGRRFLSPAHTLAGCWDEEDEARTVPVMGRRQ
jgi:nitroimidazol reductase NimA-like FMN-containing flavoprotein (pyridoxamine 5'-phosphate oxidase superfamily)